MQMRLLSGGVKADEMGRPFRMWWHGVRLGLGCRYQVESILAVLFCSFPPRVAVFFLLLSFCKKRFTLRRLLLLLY